MKKILFILPKTKQGGAETQLLQLLKGLTSTNKIYLGLLYHSNELEAEFKSIKNLEIINFNKKNKLDIAIYFRIAKFIKLNKIDFIQTFLGNHHAYLPAFLAGNCIPIGGIRGTQDKEFSVRERFIEFFVTKSFMKISRLVLVSNSYKAKELYEKKGFPVSRIFVIPNAIDCKKYSSGNANRIRKEFGIQDKILLGTVGRLIDTKKHVDLLHMMKELKKVSEDNKKSNSILTNTVLMIVGDGPMMPELQALHDELELHNDVILAGSRKDIPDLLSAFDIFVFPSISEGWPNVIGEAMAAGLPVVSFNAGDTSRIIDSGSNGYIVKDISEMKKVTIDLIKDKNRQKVVGSAARKKIQQGFSVKELLSNYEKLYHTLSRPL